MQQIPDPQIRKREDELHKRYLNKVVYGHYKEYYEHTSDTNVIFRFDYKFIADKHFFYKINLGIKSILHPGTANPLIRVRLML